jgi:hypothetical protein
VVSSSVAPQIPPSTLTTQSRRTNRAWPTSSGRDPAAAPTVVPTSATVLVTFAAIGGRPASSNAGYETRDARPPIDASRPASTPTPTSSNTHQALNGDPPGHPMALTGVD